MEETTGESHKVRFLCGLAGVFHPRVFAVDHVCEHALARTQIVTHDGRRVFGGLFRGQAYVEVADVDLEQTRQQIGKAHVRAQAGILVGTRTGVDAVARPHVIFLLVALCW